MKHSPSGLNYSPTGDPGEKFYRTCGDRKAFSRTYDHDFATESLITELIKATRTSHAANLAFCGDSNSNLALFLHCDRTCHAAPKGLTKEIIKRLEPERIQQILEPLIVTAGLFPFHDMFKQKKSSNAAFSNLSRRPGNVFWKHH